MYPCFDDRRNLLRRTSTYNKWPGHVRYNQRRVQLSTVRRMTCHAVETTITHICPQVHIMLEHPFPPIYIYLPQNRPVVSSPHFPLLPTPSSTLVHTKKKLLKPNRFLRRQHFRDCVSQQTHLTDRLCPSQRNYFVEATGSGGWGVDSLQYSS